MRDPLESLNTRSSKPASTRPVSLDKKTISELIRKLLLAGSEYVHSRLATTEEEQAAGTWIATDEDQKQIGDPLGSIAIRHGAPEGAGADTLDLITAGLGAAAYLARNLTDAWQIRRARRKLAKASNEPTNHETGEPA